MELLLTASVGDVDHRLLWISLQPDGSVSVGLSDRTYVAPDFKAQHFVWSAFNRETLHYVVPSESNAKLKSIRNPHLTFHPPARFHLTANDGRKLFEGIGDLKVMLDQDPLVPWIRFVSKPVAKLSVAGVPRKLGRTSVVKIAVPNDACSVGVGVDFARIASGPAIQNALLDQYVPWQDHFLRVHAIALLPQVATLSWFHQK